jgi:hypothetical protein
MMMFFSGFVEGLRGVGITANEGWRGDGNGGGATFGQSVKKVSRFGVSRVGAAVPLARKKNPQKTKNKKRPVSTVCSPQQRLVSPADISALF